MATHSSILAWRIPWIEEPGLQSMESRRVGHNWPTLTLSFTIILLKHLYLLSKLIFVILCSRNLYYYMSCPNMNAFIHLHIDCECLVCAQYVLSTGMQEWTRQIFWVSSNINTDEPWIQAHLLDHGLTLFHYSVFLWFNLKFFFFLYRFLFVLSQSNWSESPFCKWNPDFAYFVNIQLKFKLSEWNISLLFISLLVGTCLHCT